MTKTKKQNSTTNAQHRLPLYRRAWFLMLVIIVIIAAIVCTIIFLVKPGQQPDAIKDSDAAQNDISESQAPIDDGQHIDEDEPYSDPDQVTIQYEGENPNRSNELSGSITYASHDGIGTMINQYLSEGSCELKLTGSNGQIYTATSNIFAAASTSACGDFNIDVIPGVYQIEITLISGDKQGTITGEYSL